MSQEDLGSIVQIAIVPHGYEVDIFVGDDAPPGEPSGFTCRDFGPDVDTTKMAMAIFDELRAKLADPKFVERFEVTN